MFKNSNGNHNNYNNNNNQYNHHQQQQYQMNHHNHNQHWSNNNNNQYQIPATYEKQVGVDENGNPIEPEVAPENGTDIENTDVEN